VNFVPPTLSFRVPDDVPCSEGDGGTDILNPLSKSVLMTAHQISVVAPLDEEGLGVERTEDIEKGAVSFSSSSSFNCSFNYTHPSSTF
jgi:hypothetical protein